MTPVPTAQDGRDAGNSGQRETSAAVTPDLLGPMADARLMQTIHEAVEAARRFGLVRENY